MKMPLSIFPILVLFLSGCATESPREGSSNTRSQTSSDSSVVTPIAVKTMSLIEFMPNRLSVKVDVPVVVPASYELASLPKASPFSAFWMNPEDVDAANRSQNLPAANGYMQGSLSQGVGYDAKHDVFMGADDPKTLKQIGADASTLSSVVMERFTFGKYPVLLMTMKQAGTGKLLYAMYVGLNQDTNVAYIALRPAASSQTVGDYVWGELKKRLVKSTVPARVFPANAP